MVDASQDFLRVMSTSRSCTWEAQGTMVLIVHAGNCGILSSRASLSLESPPGMCLEIDWDILLSYRSCSTVRIPEPCLIHRHP